MPPADPIKSTVLEDSAPISGAEYTICGIKTTIFGFTELPSGYEAISCLWLLHPRLGSANGMKPLASTIISHYNRSLPSTSTRGLICVTFDQRNHGTRLQSKQANEAWRQGNPLHAQDMYGIYAGTSMDLSMLLSFLPAYLFAGRRSNPIDQDLVLGISLGGHAAWQVVFNEPRVEAAVVVIGCPDYASLMSDRARMSKLKSWAKDGGRTFLGSKDFPDALIREVKRTDPKGMMFGVDVVEQRSETERREKLRKCVSGKKILNLAGKEDNLVPYRCGEFFIEWLKSEVGKKNSGIMFEDKVFEGVGHEMSPAMLKQAIQFLEATIYARSNGHKKKHHRSLL